MDKALNDVLSYQTPHLFAVILNFLGRRFRQLLDTHWQELPDKPTACDLAQWMKPCGWISKFCGEMREMLLAELDVRLLPILGMIDSIHESPAVG